MFSSSWKRIVAALLLVMVCMLAVPTRASAAPNMDAFFYPATKFWTKAVDWFRAIWAGNGVRIPNDDKFGAGHSSDGRTHRKALS